MANQEKIEVKKVMRYRLDNFNYVISLNFVRGVNNSIRHYTEEGIKSLLVDQEALIAYYSKIENGDEELSIVKKNIDILKEVLADIKGDLELAGSIKNPCFDKIEDYDFRGYWKNGAKLMAIIRIEDRQGFYDVEGVKSLLNKIKRDGLKNSYEEDYLKKNLDKISNSSMEDKFKKVYYELKKVYSGLLNPALVGGGLINEFSGSNPDFSGQIKM